MQAVLSQSPLNSSADITVAEVHLRAAAKSVGAIYVGMSPWYYIKKH